MFNIDRPIKIIWSNEKVIVIILDIMVISQFLKLLSLFFFSNNFALFKLRVQGNKYLKRFALRASRSSFVVGVKPKKKKSFRIILRLCDINVQLICRLIARVTVQLSLSTSNHVYIETEVEVKELHPTKCLTWTGLERTSLLLKVNLKRRTKNENPTKSIRHQSSPLSYTR